LTDGKLSQLEKEKSQDRKADAIDERIRELEQRHEQLKLVTLALWSLLRDRSGFSESDLRKYVEQIDLLDGKRDGKAPMSQEKTICAGCNRSLIGTSAVCVYCGTPKGERTLWAHKNMEAWLLRPQQLLQRLLPHPEELLQLVDLRQHRRTRGF
jgi:RNase P subunit RPR2